MKRKSILFISIFILILISLPVTVLAATKTNDAGVTLTYPGGDVDCKDAITTTGVPVGGYIKYKFYYVLGVLKFFPEVTANGDLSVYYPYNQVPEDATHYGIAIAIYDKDGNLYGKKIQVKWTCDVPTETPPPGDQGCTPGYWKNHYSSWQPTGYFRTDFFNSVFGVEYFDEGYTLWDAIWQGGGHVRRIARHGTAGLLNAAHPDVNYPYSVDEVIQFVRTKNGDALEAANELGCPLH